MNERYGVAAALLHWLLAVTILALYALGWYMVTIPKGTPPVAYFYNLHKSIGLLAALPILLLLAWRLTHVPPPFPATMPAWEARAAHWSHVLFYVCLVLLVATGFLESNFTKFGIKFFGYQLPILGWPDREVYRFFNRFHVYLSHAFAVLIAIHTAAALKHLLFDRDQVFHRMLPGKTG